MIVPFLALAFALPMPSVDIPDEQRGSWLYHACKGTIRWMDAPNSRKPREDTENFDNCTSYISGYVEGAAVEGGSCHGDSSSVESVIRIYVSFMDRNPKLLDSYRSTGLHLALVDAYPCPAK